MNIAQRSLLWREWAKARAHLIARGMSATTADARRGALVKQALGYTLSMADWQRWKNREVDKVLAAYRGVYDGGNLHEQLRAQDQPAERQASKLAQCINLAEELWPEFLGNDPQFIRMRKLSMISKRVCGRPIDDCDDVQLSKVLGILRAQKKRELDRISEHTEKADKNPF